LHIKRQAGCPDGAALVLDTNGLTIESASSSSGGEGFGEARFRLGPKDPIRGQALNVSLTPNAHRVRIKYRTTAGSTALQWLKPKSTAGGKYPFLGTQSESILARTWIPLQDSPGVRVTYSATIRVPEGLTALMSADPDGHEGQTFRFVMREPIPSYLIALAVG